MYRRLHAEFLILHVDIGARHIRLAPGGEDKIFLIDFEASMARGDCVEEAGDDEEWDKAVSKEANEVVSVITQGIKKNRKAA